MAKKTSEFTQFKLRIRYGLRRQIEKEAKKNNRSANNEAVDRLEKSFSAVREEDFAETVKELVRAEIERQMMTIGKVQ
jgi:hypothetical protein